MISVIIPHFNQKEFLPIAVNSIHSQTLNADEIIVVDDASTDYNDFDGYLPYCDCKTIKRKVNGGVAVTRNEGVRAAKGDYIAFLSADDEWTPTFLEEAMKTMTETDADVVYSDYFRINQDGQIIAEHREFHPLSMTDFKIHAWQRCNVMFSAILIKRKVFDTVMFDDAFRFGEDYLWLLKAMFHFKFVHIPKLLGKYRVHPKMGTFRYLEQMPANDAKIKELAREYWRCPKEK
jgi:glycosyltransferase involved in cell wall biosynthesis